MKQNKPKASKTYDEEILMRAQDKITKRRKKIAYGITITILLLIMCMSLFGLLKTVAEKKQHEKDAEKLVEMVEPATQAETETYPEEPKEYLPKYRAPYQINSDLVGWIRVPNTAVNHPVVQSKDNSFYLHRDFETKTYQKHGRGTIFMDHRNHAKTLDKNTILYGHNYLDSTMFSDLEKFKDIEFYKTTPLIYFDTVYQEYTFQVFAVFYSVADAQLDNGYVFNYIYPSMTDDNFEDFIAEVEKRSFYHTGVQVEKTDRILTLSTCTRDLDLHYGQQKNVRLVIMGRMVKDGETPDVDVSLARENENPKHPQLYYDKHQLENPFKEDEKWYPIGV